MPILPANSRDTADTGQIPGWEDPLEEEMALRQYFWVENSADRGAQSAMSIESQRVGHYCTLSSRTVINQGLEEHEC